MGGRFSWRRVGEALLLGSAGLGFIVWMSSVFDSTSIGVFSLYAALALFGLLAQIWTATRKAVSRREWAIAILFIVGLLLAGALHAWSVARS